jgi:hypothetical protein
MGLDAGGAGAYVDMPHVAIYAEPLQVESYANLLQLQFDRLETWAQQLDADIRHAVVQGQLSLASMAGPTVEGLWTVAQWKKASALGPLQVRSSTIRAIDSALADYHACHWQNQYTKKLAALVKVFLNVVQHRQDKAQSARSEAVLALGAQVLGTLRTVA